MSDEQKAEDKYETVKWVYGGVRVNASKQRAHAFLPDPDNINDENIYKFTGLSAVIGGFYEVQRLVGSDSTINAGTPVYTGDRVDDDTRRLLWAKDTAAKTRLSNLSSERADAKANPVDELLDPIIEILQRLNSGADKDAMTSHIMRRLLSEAWNRPKRK